MLDHSSSDPIQFQKRSKNVSPRTPTTKSIRLFFGRISQVIIILLLQVFILHSIFTSPSVSVSSSDPDVGEKIPPVQLPKQIRTVDSVSAPTHSKETIFSTTNNNCKHGMVYVYDLPTMFNQDLLDNCGDLDMWHSRCKAISNNGLGPKATGLSGVPENLVPSWYWTDMFAGEVIYHSRILKHKCRTTEPGSATAFYMPFYAGLAVGKYLFTYGAKERDAPCSRFLAWIRDQPTWRRSNGSDHFIMLGRMTWDFRRPRDEDWGSSFLFMPLMKRVIRLGVERDPWDELEISVPYPTGFHPRSKLELGQWLDFVHTRKRTSLFTFVGAKRLKIRGDFRGILQSHCRNESDSCRVVDCSGTRCYDGTSEILRAFLASDFCLQPRGDAHTRRSTFDCMLAGSIPVFFWKRSIRPQYEWFLGDEPDEFSVFIDNKDVRNGTSVRKVLEGISREEVRKMREKVISLIPRFVYRNIDGDEFGGDAFDVAIDGVLKMIQGQKGKKNGTVSIGLAKSSLTKIGSNTTTGNG